MTYLNILLWMVAVIAWSIVLADTKVGRWVTDNPVSRRFILPLWTRIKAGVQWAGRRAFRVR